MSSKNPSKCLLRIPDFTREEISGLISKAEHIKKNPEKYCDKLKSKTMLMIFEKPSLRTRVSFEAAMAQMGGQAIYLDANSSPMGTKESISDTAKVSSRYCELIIARMFEQDDIEELAHNATVPVINALTNLTHPCQILSDLLTIKEKKGFGKKLKLAYLGDSYNNITHSLLFGCSLMGIDIAVGCPNEMIPKKEIFEEAKKYAAKSKSKITITTNPVEAAKDADIVYADSWMSYHVPKEEREKRFKVLMPYQINKELMKHAKKDAIFMNCLPAKRGEEQTADVIDGRQSVVFDQAENRLHMQKAIILKLLGIE